MALATARAPRAARRAAAAAAAALLVAASLLVCADAYSAGVVRGENVLDGAAEEAGPTPVRLRCARREAGGGNEEDEEEEAAEDAAGAAEGDPLAALLEEGARPTRIVREKHTVYRKDCEETSRTVTVTNHNRITRGGDPLPAGLVRPGGKPAAESSESSDEDEDDGGWFSRDPSAVSARLSAQATTFEARAVSWDAKEKFYGTPEGEEVASFARHPRGGYVQFEFSEPVPFEGAALYVDAGDNAPTGATLSVQYRARCEGARDAPRGDRWRDAVPSTGKLRRGWNSFRWNATAAAGEGPAAFGCWRWLLLDSADAEGKLTEFRWYPHARTVEERVRDLARRLLKCDEEPWRDLELRFPWSAKGAKPQVRRDCDGVVRMRGLVTFERRELPKVSSQTNPPIAVLPERYRPRQWSAFVAATGRGLGKRSGAGDSIDVERNRGWAGAVYVQSDGALLAEVFDIEFLSLDQVVYSAGKAALRDWKELDPADPFSPFYKTQVALRADFNGVIHLDGAVATDLEEARAAERNRGNPMEKPPAVLAVANATRPLRAVTCPAVTGHVRAGRRAARLGRRVDEVVNAVAAGTVRVESDGRVLPRQFSAEFLSLNGVFWSSRAQERDWRPVQNLQAPWRARNQLQMRRDSEGNVYLRGWIGATPATDGDLRFSVEPTPAFTLPLGWRPARATVLAVSTGPGPSRVPRLFDAALDSGTAGTLYVLPDGRVMPVSFDEGFVSLDCVRFSTVE